MSRKQDQSAPDRFQPPAISLFEVTNNIDHMRDMKTFKGIIFDFNGVLWWDGHLHIKAWQSFAKSLRGKDLSKDEITVHMHGRTNQYVFSYLLSREVKGEELNDLINKKESFYRELCLAQGDRFALSPGAVDLLDFLSCLQIPRTIATASERTNLDFFVRHLELSKWFRIADIAYDDGTLPGKPDPEIYRRAAHNIGLNPYDCVVVEDAYSGIQAAFAAGIGHIIALGPKSKQGKLGSIEGVDEVVSHLGEIRKEDLFIEHYNHSEPAISMERIHPR